MLKNPQTEEQMIAEGAEFKVGHLYYKLINGRLHRARKEDEEWVVAYHSRADYKGRTGFVDLKTEVKEENNGSMKNELYASLELQISMAQDYSEWLKQETKRNDELLSAHSTALRRLNELMVQSPSEEENVDSGRGEELPEGLKWKDAPEWATRLAKWESEEDTYYVWCNTFRYSFVGETVVFYFKGERCFTSTAELDLVAIRPKEV